MTVPRLMVDVLLLGAITVGSARVAPAGNGFENQSPNRDKATNSRPSEVQDSMDETFALAVLSHGQDYVRAEKSLRDGGDSAKATLKKNLVNPDPVTRLIALVLFEWMEGAKPENQKALDYLDGLPKRLARTPVTMPPPDGVAIELKNRFGGRVAEVLAMRLVKGTDWPRWRSLAVILYLQDQALPSTTAPLIRFASDTNDDTLRNAAVEAIKSVHDPEIRAKITAEKLRLAVQDRVLPEGLRAMAPR